MDEELQSLAELEEGLDSGETARTRKMATYQVYQKRTSRPKD